MSSPQDLLELFRGLQATDNATVQAANNALLNMMREMPIQFVCLSSHILLSDDVPISAVQQAAILIGRVFTPRPLFPMKKVLKMWQDLDNEKERAQIKSALFRGLMYQQQTVREASAYTIVTILKADADGKRWTDFYDQIFALIFEDYGRWAKIGALYTLQLVFEEEHRVSIVPPAEQLKMITGRLFEFSMNLITNDSVEVDAKCVATRLLIAAIQFESGDLSISSLLTCEMVDSMVFSLVQQAQNPDMKYARTVCELIVVCLRLFYDRIDTFMRVIFEFLKAQLESKDGDRHILALLLLMDIGKLERTIFVQRQTLSVVVKTLAESFDEVLLMMLTTVEYDEQDKSPRYELAKDCMTIFAQCGCRELMFGHCAQMCKRNLANEAWPLRFAAIYCNKCFLYDDDCGFCCDYLGELIGYLIDLSKDPNALVASTAVKMIARIIRYFRRILQTPGFVPRIIEFVLNLISQGPNLANAATRIVKSFARACDVGDQANVVDCWFESLAKPMFELLNSPQAIPHFDLSLNLSLAQGALIENLSSEGAKLLIPMYREVVNRIAFVLSNEFATKLSAMYPQLNILAATQELLSSLFYIGNTITKTITKFWKPSDEPVSHEILTTSRMAVDMLFEILRNPRSLHIAERLAIEMLDTLVLKVTVIFEAGIDGLLECLLNELDTSSPEVVVQVIILIGDMFTTLPNHTVAHHRVFMDKIFEKLHDQNLLLNYATPMFYTLGDIVAVIPPDECCQYVEPVLEIYRLFMGAVNKDVEIQKQLLRSLLNVARGLVKTFGGIDNTDVKRMLRNARIAMFWPIKEFQKQELCDRRTLEMGLSFLELVLASPVAKSAFSVELLQGARLVLDPILAINPSPLMRIRVERVRKALPKR